MKRPFCFNKLILGISKICSARIHAGRWFKTLLSLLGFWALANGVQGQTLTTNDFGPLSYCPGSSFSVNYTITGSFNTGNEFRVQLSDASGNFIDGDNSSNIIGSISSAMGITATLPNTQAAGMGYRVRVVSTNPVVNVTNASDDDNAQNIRVLPRIITPTYPNPLGPYCVGAPISVPFTVNCNFISTNSFILELSDASGDFSAAGYPIQFAFNSTALSASLMGNIPSVPSGSGYKLRIRATAPDIISASSTAFAINSPPVVAPRVYVNQAVAASGIGSSWATAFKTLQEALSAANNTCTGITQIWVAKGTYYPDEGGSFANDDRNAAFTMKSGVSIYGGFVGDEASNYVLSLRNFVTNETILSGDLDQNDGANFANNGGNAYHVIYNHSNGLFNNTILDGFTVKGGNANGDPGNSSFLNLGGGMFNYGVAPTVSNCLFTDNTALVAGGGLSAHIRPAQLGLTLPLDNIKISKCTFSNNTSATLGGGMHTFQNSASIENTIFSKNSASTYGGGLSISDCLGSGVSLSNVVFSANSAVTLGGGLSSGGSRVNIINGTFSNNSVSSASNGGGIWFSNDIFGADLRLLNCVFWGNTSAGNPNSLKGSGMYAANCDIQGLNGVIGLNPVNCIDQNPLFVNAADPDGGDNQWMTADDGLQLQSCSPSLNTGVSSATLSTIVLNAPTTDILGSARVGTTDMGAYEFQGTLPTTLYVNQAVSNSGDGASWATAFKTLQEALQLNCPSVTQIWVAKGTYYPDEGGSFANNDPRASFTMKNNLAIYGGFSGNGTETMLSQRNWTANPTILSGDIDKNSTLGAGNSYHVVFNNFTSGTPLTSTALMDGFTISGGYAYGSIMGQPSDTRGGGMYNKYASPTLSNCNFSNNTSSGGIGGGMYNEDSSPAISYCTFSNNQVIVGNGGGMYNLNSSPTVSYCTFSTNSSNSGYGGGMYNNNSSPAVSHSTFSNNNISGSGVGGSGMANRSSSPTISYCTFSNNTSQGTVYGGGMYNDSSSPSVSNCIFSGNQVAFGGGIYNNGGCTASIINCTFSRNTTYTNGSGGGIYNSGSSCQPTVKNCLFWGNFTNEIANVNDASPIVTYCDVQGGYAGTGNINADPLIVDATDPDGADNIFGTADDNLRLSACSPAINAGTNTGAPTTDILGNARVGTTDMGAFEAQGSLSPLVSAPTVTQPTCTTPTGTIVVNATGGGTLEYSIDNGSNWQSPATFMNLAVGNYTIKVRSQASPTCEATYGSNPVVINPQPATPTASISGNNSPICAGANATFTLTGTSGATLTYNINGGSNSTIVLTGGTATVTANTVTANQTLNLVSISNGTCGQNLTGNSTVTVNPLPTITTAASPSICVGATSFATPYTATTGSPTTYSISGTGITTVTDATLAASPIMVNLSSGASGSSISYTLTVKNANGCTSSNITGNVTVTPNNTISLTSVAGTNAQTKCINTPLTNITYATTGATGATFSGLPTGVSGAWANNVATIGGTPTTATGSPFSYTVTLTGGCGTVTATGTITVTTPSAAPTVGTIIQPTCTTATGSVPLSGLPTVGSWTLTRSPGAVSSTGTGTTTTVSGLAANTYSFTVTNVDGCTSASSSNAVINVQPSTPSTFSMTGGGLATCGTGVAVGLSASQTATTYQLKKDGIDLGSPVAGTGSALAFGLQNAVGTYSVVATATTGGCTATMTGSAVVTVLASISSFTVSGGGVACGAGSNSGTGGAGVGISLSGSQIGVSYQLRRGTINSGTAVAGTGSRSEERRVGKEC